MKDCKKMLLLKMTKKQNQKYFCSMVERKKMITEGKSVMFAPCKDKRKIFFE